MLSSSFSFANGAIECCIGQPREIDCLSPDDVSNPVHCCFAGSLKQLYHWLVILMECLIPPEYDKSSYAEYESK